MSQNSHLSNPAARSLPTVSAPGSNVRTLVIGPEAITGTTLSWTVVPGQIPPLLSYDLIIVVPTPGTNASQQALWKKINNDLALVESTAIRIIWLLTPDTSPEVLASLGVKRMAPVRPEPTDSVSCRVPLTFTADHVCFAIGDLDAHLISLARLRSVRTKTTITVAAMTIDSRWILLPPSPLDSLVSLRIRVLDARPVAAVAAAILIVLLLLGVRQHHHLAVNYQRGVSALGVASPLSTITAWNSSESEWQPPAEVMAKRIIRTNRRAIMNLAGRLRPARTLVSLMPHDHELDNESNDPVDALALFDIALLTGDLGTARDVLIAGRPTGLQRYWWSRLLTIRLWQRGVEAVHELDFETASYYVPLYLSMMRNVTSDAETTDDLEPQRTRTLAQVLAREISSNRITALCSHPGIETSFGALLDGDWGFPVEERAGPTLETSRHSFSVDQCRNALTFTVDYSKILTPAETCLDSYTLECTFTTLRDDILGGRLVGSERSVTTFLAQCSYLSDDLLAAILTSDTALLSAWAADAVFTCDAAYDYRPLNAESLEDWDCSRLIFSPGELKTNEPRKLTARCRL